MRYYLDTHEYDINATAKADADSISYTASDESELLKKES